MSKLIKVFFTDRLDLYDNEDFKAADITVYKLDPAKLKAFHKWIKDSKAIAYDIETVGDQFNGDIVLHSFCDDKMVACFDGFSYSIDQLANGCGANLWGNTTMIAHNAQYECKWLDAQVTLEGGPNKVLPQRIFDTMVVEQKLMQGMPDGLMRYDLVSVLHRRGVSTPPHMDKKIREDFKQGYTMHTSAHVLYNMADTVKLHELMDKQQALIDKMNMNFFIHGIHMPLVRILAQMENNPWMLDEQKWKQLANEAEAKMNSLADQMDKYCIDVLGIDPKTLNTDYTKELDRANKAVARDQMYLANARTKIENLVANNKTHLKAYSLLVVRKTQLKLSISANIKLIEKLSKDADYGLNWSSSNQVLELFDVAGIKPVPMAKSATTKKLQPSTGVAAREKWLLENKNHTHYKLIEMLDEYAGYSKHVNSFGHSFLTKYRNASTKGFHTTYKQGRTATGRLASGDASSGLFNSQQLPRKPLELRHCFMAREGGYKIATVDLEGAELVTMCSLAKDENLRRIHAAGDMHSYFANKGWKAIYESKGLQYTEADVISKHQNTSKRTDYKPMMFGTVYGLKGPKAAETLNVTKKEGEIAIDTIVNEIPDTINMVEEASKHALTYGYVVHNERTNSRRWFKPILDQIKGNPHVSDKAIYAAESAARNTRIQGKHKCPVKIG